MSRRDIKFAQHYVECTQCEGNAEYYCTTCTDNLCQVCRDRHTKSKATKSHSIVPYHERQTTSQESETCMRHPKLSYDMACRECQLPVCIRCMKEDHRGHTFKNIDEVLQELDSLCNDKVKKIKEKILPKWRDRLSQLSDRRTKSEESVIEIKKKLQEDTKMIKDLADAILEEKMKEIETNELLLNNEYGSLTNSTENTVSKYQSLITEYENERKSYEKLRLQKEILQTDVSEPAFQTPDAPSYQNEKIKREEIVKHFGKLLLTKKALGTRSAIKCQEFELPFDLSIHISYVPSEKFWIGNSKGQIILTDKTGKQLDEIKINGLALWGYHTVTEREELMFIEQSGNCIKKYTSERQTSTVINTGDWTPISVYSSHRNNDILVGITNFNLSDCPYRVVRYNKNGREIWQSQNNDKGQPLYQLPVYITENMNGDICISDEEAVVVVDKEGKHRFTYRGSKEGSKFSSYGICTDIQGRILVLDKDDNVHVIDQDGKFIKFLLTKDDGISKAFGLCTDKDNNLWICCRSTVKMYKYLFES